jgi:hypothetical protein
VNKVIAKGLVSRHLRDAKPEELRMMSRILLYIFLDLRTGDDGNYVEVQDKDQNYFGSSNGMVTVAVRQAYSQILKTHPNFSASLRVTDGDDASHKVLVRFY